LLKSILIFLGVIVAAAPVCAIEEQSASPAADTRGIQHLLYLAVRSDPSSNLRAQGRDEPSTARLVVNVQISAHSRESNFYGVLPVTIGDFDLVKGSTDREIWRDERCHHERGFPKITVTGIDGVVTSGQQKFSVGARYRKLGLFLPRDEVLASKRVGEGSDDIGAYIATRTETKQSRLFVDLKLYTMPCVLTSGPT